MKRLFPALTAALMASSMAALPLYAQEGASQNAPGVVKQELDQGSAKTQAPGTRQNSEAVDGAREAAPGQAMKQDKPAGAEASCALS